MPLINYEEGKENEAGKNKQEWRPLLIKIDHGARGTQFPMKRDTTTHTPHTHS